MNVRAGSLGVVAASIPTVAIGAIVYSGPMNVPVTAPVDPRDPPTYVPIDLDGDGFHDIVGFSAADGIGNRIAGLAVSYIVNVPSTGYGIPTGIKTVEDGLASALGPSVPVLENTKISLPGTFPSVVGGVEADSGIFSGKAGAGSFTNLGVGNTGFFGVLFAADVDGLDYPTTGWVEVTSTGSFGFTINRWAYETSPAPGTIILTGAIASDVAPGGGSGNVGPVAAQQRADNTQMAMYRQMQRHQRVQRIAAARR